MFKRQSKPPAVSPLDPPPASTRPTTTTSRTLQQPQPQSQYSNANGTLSPHPSSAAARYSPNTAETPGMVGIHRVDTSKSDGGEKRRSGFFGRKKDKDKDKEKEKERERERQKGRAMIEEPRPRPSSFSVDRPNVPAKGSLNNHPSFNANTMDIDGLPPQSLRQFPPPQSGHTPPPPLGQQRVVSSPQQSSAPPREFSPAGTGRNGGAGGTFPKSQSMGFSRSPIPDNHPYRGSLNTIPDQPSQISRSSSMPLDNPHPQQQGAQPSPPGSSHRATDGPNRPPLSASLEEFEPIVELISIQPQKTYVASPPELEMILARTSAGGQPKQGQPGSATNDWDSVWLQLSGISLSMWSMKETRAAAAKGEKVPPTYFNVTDSSLELLAPLPPPPHRPTSHPHHFVFSLNTAGSNRLLFSCPAERDLARWATGLRLAAWERARLEEIYTGHLIKSGRKEPKNELVKGRMEGWVRVRVMGGTDWKRLWVVLSTPSSEGDKEDEKKNRRRSFFGLGEKQPETIQEPNTGVSMASFYLEPRTPKNKTSLATLTISNVTQAYAVFPERLEVMSQSNLFKIVGRVGGDMVTIEGRLRDSGWALIMPESPENAPPQFTPLNNMMRWVTGFHDVFSLYGRPERYNWDESDMKSLMFAYPRGDDRESLFLTLDEAMSADFRANQLPAVRSQFNSIMQRKQTAIPDETYLPDGEGVPTPRLESYRLPPLPFVSNSPHTSETGPRSLTPITEKSIDMASRQNSTRTQKSGFWMNDRTNSGSGSGGGGHQAQAHKQSSGGSLRLAPIADSSETFGQLTEEPQQDSTTTPTPTFETGQTPSSIWSQPSEQTAMPEQEHLVHHNLTMPEPRIHTQTFDDSHQTFAPLNDVRASTAAHTPLDFQRSSQTQSIPTQARSPPTQTQSPPAQVAISTETPSLPGSFPVASSQPVQEPSQPTQPPTATAQQQPEGQGNDANILSATTSPTSPALAAPLQPSSSLGHKVLSPTPRRVSTGEAASPAQGALHEEPAAMYLMNMVEDDEPAADISPSRLRPTINTDVNGAKPAESLGRKPSGARAPPPKKGSSGSRQLEAIDDEPQPQSHLQASSTHTDLGEDATAFIAYAEQPSPAKPVARDVPALSPPTVVPVKEEEMRSSFAPSRAAAERRAKADQVTADQQNARNVPGGGKRIGGTQTWSGSEDEDEEEDSPVIQQAPQHIPARQASPEPPIQRVMSQTRALPPVPRPTNGYDTRQSYMAPPQPAERSVSNSSTANQRQLPQQPQPAPAPPAARQSVWNANFAAEHGMPESKSGKFVELDEPAHLTTAFAPHGLLQAGIQDKEDRSAKKQEELAREMGSSLINVPAKPPPPQTGLLGAVAQHERDRKNAGGIGATLTDREREKRLAEERQRDVEKMQRQQMEQMRQFGDPNMMSMYGQQPYSPYGMMGMPPPMPYQPYQGGYNPYAQQHAMMAAQIAYQQAMMAMSQSQAPAHDDRPHSPGTSASPAPSFGGAGAGASSPAPSPFGVGVGVAGSPSPYGGPQAFGYGFPPTMPPYGMWGSPAPQNPWMFPQNGSSAAGAGSAMYPPNGMGFGNGQPGNGNGMMGPPTPTPGTGEGGDLNSRVQSMNMDEQQRAT